MRERERVQVAGDIARRPGIGVVEPRSAQLGRGLKQGHVMIAQRHRCRHATKACPDDDDLRHVGAIVAADAASGEGVLGVHARRARDQRDDVIDQRGIHEVQGGVELAGAVPVQPLPADIPAGGPTGAVPV
jgi:hypothetical protein